MKPFPEEPTFTPGEVGFDSKDANGRPYDLLERKLVGQRLTDLLDSVEKPLVIALDGGWGSGKSHFLKLWTGAHSLEHSGKAKVIYFDAFEHDYLDDPLISLVARLTTDQAKATWGTKAVNTMRKAAMPLARLGLRLGVAAATAGVTEIAGPVAEAVATKTGEATQASVNAFWKRETGRIAAMQQFRDALTALTEGDDAQGKIVFIIDELDRCRPDYALTLLEIVKHFFAVPNVHFVLGTNLFALQNSVKARYGTGINSAHYLQKFIHLTLTLPKVTTPDGKGSTALHYFTEMNETVRLLADVAGEIRYLLEPLSIRQEVSLRDVQRIMTYSALLPAGFKDSSSGLKIAVMGALFLKVLAPHLYRKIYTGDLALTEMQEFLRPPLPLTGKRPA